MTQDSNKFYFLLGVTLVVGGLVGAAIGAATVKNGWSPEVIANIGVAVGTLALAVVTFESVMKTNDVISGEDRRHQVGFAPLVVIQYRLTESKTVELSTNRRATIPGQQYVVLYNQGFGIATNVYILIGNAESRMDFRIIAVKDETPVQFSKEITPGDNLTVHYDDMFGNHYRTIYPKYGDYVHFDWKPPQNLKQPQKTLQPLT